MDANSILFTLSAIVQSLAAVAAVVGTFIIFSVQYFIRGREIRERETRNIFNVKGIKSSIVFLMLLIPSTYFPIITHFHAKFRSLLLGNFLPLLFLIIFYIFLSYAIHLSAALVITYAEKTESMALKWLIKIIGSLMLGSSLAWFFIAYLLIAYSPPPSKIQTNLLILPIIFSAFVFMVVVSGASGRLGFVSIFIKEKISAQFISKADNLWIVLVFLMTVGLLLPLIDTIVYSITIMPDITEISLNSTNITTSQIEPIVSDIIF